jgi:hypothetical protein
MSFVPPNIERQRLPARGILLGAGIALAVVGLAVWLWTGMGFLQLIGLFRGGTTVINVSYTMDKIMSGERNNAYLPKFLAGDRLLLVVHGDVIAGVDLGKVQPTDVSVHGRTISLRIPGAEIFTTRIDNARTRVYSRDTGLFSVADPNLESEVREEAERQLQQAALQDGVLKTADQNARTTLSRMLTGLGFEQVEFR